MGQLKVFASVTNTDRLSGKLTVQYSTIYSVGCRGRGQSGSVSLHVGLRVSQSHMVLDSKFCDSIAIHRHFAVYSSSGMYLETV